MTRLMVSSGLLMAVLSIVFAIMVFLSKTMFEDARAAASDFRLHERFATEVHGRLEKKDAELEQRIESLQQGIFSANRKLDLLLEKHLK